jgi:hypothetical protein
MVFNYDYSLAQLVRDVDWQGHEGGFTPSPPCHLANRPRAANTATATQANLMPAN